LGNSDAILALPGGGTKTKNAGILIPAFFVCAFSICRTKLIIKRFCTIQYAIVNNFQIFGFNCTQQVDF